MPGFEDVLARTRQKAAADQLTKQRQHQADRQSSMDAEEAERLKVEAIKKSIEWKKLQSLVASEVIPALKMFTSVYRLPERVKRAFPVNHNWKKDAHYFEYKIEEDPLNMAIHTQVEWISGTETKDESDGDGGTFRSHEVTTSEQKNFSVVFSPEESKLRFKMTRETFGGPYRERRLENSGIYELPLPKGYSVLEGHEICSYSDFINSLAENLIRCEREGWAGYISYLPKTKRPGYNSIRI